MSIPCSNDSLIVYSFQSDDPLSTTCSDIDSQPRTPFNSELDDSFSSSQPAAVQYDSDGVFKRPASPPEPRTPGKPDGTISKRTRSKFPLNATDIETIEENFIPPDLLPGDIDVYEADAEPDESWLDFLKEFQKPLSEFNAF